MNDISDEEQHFLFELIERWHDEASTIFCTQYKKEDWFDQLESNKVNTPTMICPAIVKNGNIIKRGKVFIKA